jgi:hypothetical protein
MSTDIENLSVTFTEEAESALRRIVARVERQIRARASEEAIRNRGIPAEVTGSDVQRASNRSLRGYGYGTSTHFSRRRLREDSRFGNRRIISGPSISTRKRSSLERLASLYVWLGVIGLVFGLLWAPTSSLIKVLWANPAWRAGLVITQAAGVTLALGIAVKFYARKIRQNQMQREQDSAI